MHKSAQFISVSLCTAQCHYIYKPARAIADLAGRKYIQSPHLEGALQYRLKLMYNTCIGSTYNGVLLRGSTNELDGLARQLAKFSFDFSVCEPDDLRVTLHHLAEKLAAK